MPLTPEQEATLQSFASQRDAALAEIRLKSDELERIKEQVKIYTDSHNTLASQISEARIELQKVIDERTPTIVSLDANIEEKKAKVDSLDYTITHLSRALNEIPDLYKKTEEMISRVATDVASTKVQLSEITQASVQASLSIQKTVSDIATIASDFANKVDGVITDLLRTQSSQEQRTRDLDQRSANLDMRERLMGKEI